MNNELDSVGMGDTNFKQAAIDSRADKHDEIVEIEHSDRVSVCVEPDPRSSTYLDNSPPGITAA